MPIFILVDLLYGLLLISVSTCMMTVCVSSDILKIDHLWQFTSLTKLQLDNNIIEKIQGLEKLTNLVWLGEFSFLSFFFFLEYFFNIKIFVYI